MLCTVLLSGLAVVALALGSEVGLQLRITRNVCEAHQALLNARTGIEYALYLARTNTAWRTSYSGSPIVRAFPAGSFTVTLSDATDGQLNNCPIDPVTIQSVGTSGLATRKLQAQAVPPPHPATRYVAFSTSDKTVLGQGSVLFGDIRSNDNIEKGSGALASVSGHMTVPTGKTISNDFRDVDTAAFNSAQALAAPPANLDWYTANGTQITPPQSGGVWQLIRQVLSSTANPWGAPNAKGIYWFDASTRDVEIRSCRLIATLVILNANKVYVRDGAWQTPARPASYQLPPAPAGNGFYYTWVYPGVQGSTNNKMLQDCTYSTGRTSPPDIDGAANSIAGTTVHNDNNTTRGDTNDYWTRDIFLPCDADWYAWARYYAPGLNFNPANPTDCGDPNSFRLTISGGVSLAVLGNSVLDGSGHWGWKRWLWAGQNIQYGDPQRLYLGWLAKGRHTLTIYDRSAEPLAGGGTNAPRLDVMLLTNDGNFSPTDAAVPWLEASAADADGAGHFNPYATLLVQGELRYEIDYPMREIEENVDFDQNSVVAGTHPNVIRGILYATKQVTAFNDGTDTTPVDFVGCIIGSKVDIESRGARLRHDPQLNSQLVVGFQGNGLVLKPGTVKEVH